jgi:hypothetical protein
MYEHLTYLLLHALRASMVVKDDIDVRLRILDFIETAHENEGEIAM